MVEQEDCGGPCRAANGDKGGGCPTLGWNLAYNRSRRSLQLPSWAWSLGYSHPKYTGCFWSIHIQEFLFSQLEAGNKKLSPIFEFQNVLLCLAVSSWCPQETPQMLSFPKPFSTFCLSQHNLCSFIRTMSQYHTGFSSTLGLPHTLL